MAAAARLLTRGPSSRPYPGGVASGTIDVHLSQDWSYSEILVKFFGCRLSAGRLRAATQRNKDGAACVCPC